MSVEVQQEMSRINATSEPAYKYQDAGVGGNETALAFLKRLVGYSINANTHILDLGFGHGGVLIQSLEAGARMVGGVEINDDSFTKLKAAVGTPSQLETWKLDISRDRLPWPDDYFDVVVCTETIEHLTAPYFMAAEAKRVLKNDGIFLLAFPDPADNLGYEGGQHAHVYPGFLEKKSFRRFMMQLYFHDAVHIQNGSSAWYTYRNYKGIGMVDTFHVIAGNYSEHDLYGMMNNDVQEIS